MAQSASLFTFLGVELGTGERGVSGAALGSSKLPQHLKVSCWWHMTSSFLLLLLLVSGWLYLFVNYFLFIVLIIGGETL